MRGLLTRRQHALGIRSIEFTIIRHTCRDLGCRREAARTASSYVSDHVYALVLFDRAGCGDEMTERQAVQTAVEENLCRAGWANSSRVIVIEPELEMWVWSESANVGKLLGWNEGTGALREWLHEKHLWPDDKTKPPAPRPPRDEPPPRSSWRSCHSASRSPGTPWFPRRDSRSGAAIRTSPGRAPAAPSGSAPPGSLLRRLAPPDPPAASPRRTPCRRPGSRTGGHPEAPARP